MSKAVTGSVFVNTFAIPRGAGHDLRLKEGAEDERIAQDTETTPTGATSKIDGDGLSEVVEMMSCKDKTIKLTGDLKEELIASMASGSFGKRLGMSSGLELTGIKRLAILLGSAADEFFVISGRGASAMIKMRHDHIGVVTKEVQQDHGVDAARDGENFVHIIYILSCYNRVMLVNSSRLVGRPVMSLQLGGPVAHVVAPVIDPDDLRIIAFVVEGPMIGGDVGNILDVQSVREFSSMGLIIDSTDELVEQDDVIKIRDVMALNFDLIGLKVETKKGSRLGKIEEYTVDAGSLMVQQLIVRRPLRKSLMDPQLTIGRSQIVAVDDYKVTVRDEEEKIREKASAEDFVPNFVNPFRVGGALSSKESSPTVKELEQ